MPRIIALFFLVVMTQALTYPLVIFSIYSTPSVHGEAKSLPVDFPDNGQTCFFGTGNSEEENECERQFSSLRPLISQDSSVSFERFSAGDFFSRQNETLSLHPEKVLSPPPEQVFYKA